MTSELDIPNWLAVIMGIVVAFGFYLYARKQSEKDTFHQIERICSALSLIFSDKGDLSINRDLEIKFKSHKDTFTQSSFKANLDGILPLDRIIIEPKKEYGEFERGRNIL